MRLGFAVIGFFGALSVAGCGTRPALPSRPVAENVRVRAGAAGAVRSVPLEDYVAATAVSEIHPAGGEPERVRAMFEVQTIIARTYAQAHRGRHAREGFDLCSTTHCQIYEPDRLATSQWRAAVRDASARSAGMILRYDGAAADAVYHADCGGRTSAAVDVWGGGGFPYLRAVRDDGNARDAHAAWRHVVEADALRRALDADPRTRVGRLTSITVLSRDGSGRAQRVLLRGTRELGVAGADFRTVATNALGARSIRSTRFEVRRDGAQFVFSGSGFGHGVGLCQAGAIARLAAGESVRSVLQRYYPGTVLVDAARAGLSSRPRPALMSYLRVPRRSNL
jgi:stage II sporulation protein D